MKISKRIISLFENLNSDAVNFSSKSRQFELPDILRSIDFMDKTETTDKTYSTLPKKSRTITDSLCFNFSWPIFLSTLVLFVMVVFQGKNFSILHPEDGMGYRCGVNNQKIDSKLPDYSNLPYLSYIKSTLTCTKKCNGTAFMSYCLPNNRRELRKSPKYFRIMSDFSNYKSGLILFVCAAIFLAFPTYYIISKLAFSAVVLLSGILLTLSVIVLLWSLKQGYLWLSFGCIAFDFILVFSVYFLRKQLRLVSPLVTFSVRSLIRSPKSLLAPFVFLVFVLLCALFAFYGFIFSKGIAEPVLDTETTELVLFRHSSLRATSILFPLIAFWGIAYASTLVSISVSHTTAMMYFQNKSTGYIESLKLISKFHTGTVFFGSFAVFILEGLSALFIFLQQRIEKTKNQIVKYICNMMLAILFLVANFASQINHLSFVFTAIKGTSFWDGCSESMSALSSRTFMSFETVLRHIFFSARIIITLGVSIVSWLYLDSLDLYFITLPALGIPIIVFFSISAAEMLIKTATETTLVCLWEDASVKSGVHYAPSELTDILDTFAEEYNTVDV